MLTTLSTSITVLEEAVAELFALLSASPGWLKQVGLISEDLSVEKANQVSLAITAMDVIPRMAYYTSADKWRLEVFEKNETDPKELVSEWWKHR